MRATLQAHREHFHRIVGTPRSRDVSWARIAEPLDVTRQSVWERLGRA